MKKFVAVITLVSTLCAISSNAFAVEPNPAATPVPNASTPNPQASQTTVQPSFAAFISKNKNKDSALANGILFFEGKYFDKAMSEFKKAQSFGNDFFIRRWIKVTENRQKIEAAEKKKAMYEKTTSKSL